MANIIKIKRGLSKHLWNAQLQEGEMAFTTDTKKLYISNTDEPINNDTTYSLSKSGSTITLTGSDGSKTSVTDADTNTTYNAATTSANGLMTSAMVTKLNGIAEGANKYTLPIASSTLGGVKTTSTVTSTSGLTACPIISGVPYYKDTNTTYTLPNATSSTLGGVKIGSNITISSGTISLTKDNVTAALGYTPPTTNTTYSAVTTSANGLMIASDKSKLDGIASGATKNTASSTTPKANGTAAVGSESNYARGDHVHPLQTTISGNAGSATKLATARTISLAGDVTGSASFDGSANVSITATVADNSHNHSTITIPDTRNDNQTPAWYQTNYPYKVITEFKNCEAIGLSGATYCKLTTYVHWGNSSGGYPTQEATVLGKQYTRYGTGADTWSTWATTYSTVNAPTSVSGNAGTATKLKTARTLTIGSTGKTFDGSGNVSWTLAEIGAAASSHSHNYLPLTGGNLTGHLGIICKYELGSFYNYTNGCLIEIGSADSYLMVAIHITGNSYAAGVPPINSMFQFYNYGTDGGFLAYSGRNFGHQLGNMTVFRYNGKVYAWIQQALQYQTLSFQLLTNMGNLTPIVTNAAIPSSGTSLKTTITPDNPTAVATTNSHGLMASDMVTKLNGIATGANAYTLPNATSSVLGGVKIGSNITVSSGTISLTKANVTSALGYTPPTTNTTYSVVSTSADGLCPKRGGTTTKFLRDDGTWAVPPDTNTTYSAATTSANGLMSSSDKTKLNGIATGAQVNNVVVSTSTPTASTAQVWINPNGQSALDAVSVIGEYAEYRLTAHQSVSQAATWGDIFVPFSTGTFTTSNSSMFSASGNGIKCNFTGRVMVIANIGTSQTGKELDLEIYNSNGSPSQRNTINISQGTVNSTHVFEVNSGAVITTGFNSNSLSFTVYKDSTLILVRIK